MADRHPLQRDLDRIRRYDAVALVLNGILLAAVFASIILRLTH